MQESILKKLLKKKETFDENCKHCKEVDNNKCSFMNCSKENCENICEECKKNCKECKCCIEYVGVKSKIFKYIKFKGLKCNKNHEKKG